MTQQLPKQCPQCNTFYLPHQEQQHANMHIDPSKLAPKTNPNDLRKIQLSKVILTEVITDTSDIALRSLLPEEIPQPQVERRQMRPPEIYDQAILQPVLQPLRDNNVRNYDNIRDRLEISSLLVMSDLSKDQIKKLDIEKLVDIKPIKAAVAKKEIHKFKNSQYAGREPKQLGGCQKKTLPTLLNCAQSSSAIRPSNSGVLICSEQGAGQRQAQMQAIALTQSEIGYEVQADSSYVSKISQKSSVIVPINRKTSNPNQFKPVDTKSNQNTEQNARKGSNSKIAGSLQSESGDSKLKDAQSQLISSHLGSSHLNRLHPHECHGCHGFYCRDCGSTIPPEYRPFWDADQSPEMVEYYKKRVRECRDRERAKDKKMREGCGQCSRQMPK